MENIKEKMEGKVRRMSEVVLGTIAVAVLAVGIYCMCKDNE